MTRPPLHPLLGDKSVSRCKYELKRVALPSSDVSNLPPTESDFCINERVSAQHVETRVRPFPQNLPLRRREFPLLEYLDLPPKFRTLYERKSLLHISIHFIDYLENMDLSDENTGITETIDITSILILQSSSITSTTKTIKTVITLIIIISHTDSNGDDDDHNVNGNVQQQNQILHR